MFLQVDFGLVRNAEGELEPKLVELQAFPSLYGYQPVLARQYIESYGLPAGLGSLFGWLRSRWLYATLAESDRRRPRS